MSATLRHIIAVLLIMIGVHATAAPYYEGSMRVTFRDSARGRDIPMTIIYASDGRGGVNAPLIGTSTNTIPTFRVVVMAHGFQLPVGAYASFATNICKTFPSTIVVLPETGGELFPNHADFGSDVVSCLLYMQRENTRAGSIWYGHIANDNIVTGHSMGGGAAMLAAKEILTTTTLKLTSVIVMAPAETNPSAKQAATFVTVPTLILAGGRDCVTPLAGTVQPIYDSVSSACKVLAVIPGGSHCQFADDNALCALGEFTCRPTITRVQQFDRAFRYINFMLRRSDSVARVIDDTQVQTSMTFLKGSDIIASTVEGCIGDTIRLRTDLNGTNMRWLPGDVRGSSYAVVLRDSITRVTLVNTQCFGESSTSILLRAAPAPAISIASPPEICPFGSARLVARATNARRIEWSTGEVGDSILVRSPGVYRATAVSAFGCRSAVDSVVVRLVAVPRVGLTVRGDTIACNGRGLIVVRTDVDSQKYNRIEWSTGAVGTQLSITQPGRYSVFARAVPRDGNDCVVFSDTVIVSLRNIDAPTPTLSYERDTLWSSSGTSYLWTLDGVTIPGATKRYHVPTTSGLYQVRVAYDADRACEELSAPLTVTLTTSVPTDARSGLTIDVVSGLVTIHGCSPGEVVRLISVRGERCAEAEAGTSGTAHLRGSFANGMYLVLIGTSVSRPVLYWVE